MKKKIYADLLIIFLFLPHVAINIHSITPEETYELNPSINVLNVQSYPHIKGYWMVHFSVVGTADLIITAVNDTTWCNDYCQNTELDLIFDHIGDERGNKFNIIWKDNAVLIKNFSSNVSLYEVSKVLTTGKHTLKFTFGNDIAYAFNDATNWWDSDWQYRKLVTIDHDQVAGNLVNFPVLVSITDSDLQNDAQSDGGDIAFVSYSDNSTQFAYEIESYDNGDGSLVAWVNVTSILSTEDTRFWMYYGNTGCINQEDASGTWDSNYAMVQHMNEASGIHYDSTSNNNDGTAHIDGSGTQDATGKIDGADDFDGSNDYVDTANNLFTKPGMICLWFKTSADYGGIYGMQDVDVGGSPAWYVPIINIDNNVLKGSWGWYSNGKSQLQTALSVTNDVWHYVCLGYDLTYDYLYLDGVLVNSSAIATGNVVLNTYQQVGVLYGAGWGTLPAEWLYFDGTIDEVRVSNTPRSHSWLTTSYNNILNQSTFVTLDSEDEYVLAMVTTSGGSTTFVQEGDAVTVDTSITADGSGANPDASVEITSGYDQGFDALSGGGGSWDSNTGKLTLTDASDWSDLQNKLRSVTFDTTSEDTSDRVITFTVGESLGDGLYYSGTDHYYEFVSDSGITWNDAEAAAAGSSYAGLDGYLATVTSQGENDFIYSKLVGDGWMGASDASSESEWYWVTGPESGTKFFQQTSAASNSGNLATVYGGNTPGGGNAVSGFYNNWASGEPNDWGASGEDYAHFYQNQDGTWNDYAYDNGAVAGYVVEYGGQGFGGNASDGAAMDTKTIDIQGVNEITFSDETIADNTENVHPDTDKWSVTISHPSGTEFHWWINTTPNVGSASGISTNTNINPTCPLHNLQSYTTYTVHVTVRGSGNEQNYTFTTGGYNCNSSWYNASWLNVTVESKYPRILWYDFQKCTSYNGSAAPSDGETWESRRNQMIEVDNETWYRFIINVSSDQGWDNIQWINITCWHDNGTLDSSAGNEYNTSSNLGANRNFFLVYRNLSGKGYCNLSYPLNNTEITLGRWTEDVVSDSLGITGTETHNLTFQFRPGYQFRYAPGPGEGQAWTNYTVGNNGGYPLGNHFDPVDGCWEALNNSWSWNFNITVFNAGENWEESQYRAWVHDEFGVYSYTEIVSVNNALIEGAPDNRKYSTNSSSHFNQFAYGGDGNSHNVTVLTRSNGNYTLAVKVPDLIHIANSSTSQDLYLDNKYIYVRGGTRTEAINYTNTGRNYIYLYGNGSGNGSLASITTWESHETNGTSKFTGEAGDDGFSESYPDHYTSSTYNSHNDVSHYVEFSVLIPYGQWPGKYSANVYYCLRTQTNS